MLLKGQRPFTPMALTQLSKTLKIEDHELRFLIELLDLKDAKEKSPIDVTLKKTSFTFSPIFFGTQEIKTHIPEEWIKALSKKSYWIEGKMTIWNHIFDLDPATNILSVHRHHGHLSSTTKELHFFSKEDLRLDSDWLFVFWPHPTPQFHSMPLNESMINCEKFTGTMSGIAHNMWLENLPKDPANIVHKITRQSPVHTK